MHLKCCNDGYNRRVQSSDILYEYLKNSIQLGFVNHIVVGDWNDDISDSYSQNSFNIFLDDQDSFKYVTYENAHSNSNTYDSFPGFGSGSFIDHIMISSDLFEEFEIDFHLLFEVRGKSWVYFNWCCFKFRSLTSAIIFILPLNF